MSDVLEKELMDVLDLLQPNPVNFEEDYRILIPMGAPCPDCAYHCNGDCSGRCVADCGQGCAGVGNR
jgi:hypothetical protein